MWKLVGLEKEKSIDYLLISLFFSFGRLIGGVPKGWVELEESE